MYKEQQQRPSKPVTVKTLAKMKREGEKIAVLTAYDASFAALLEAAEVDVILVGDSLGMVVQGRKTTIPVTLDDMVYHCRAVTRGVQTPLVIVDMPFMSYPSIELTLRNAARLMQEGHAQMVKLEGGSALADSVRQLNRNGVPVCAHLGLLPQSIHKLGGYRVQGREAMSAQRMIDEALLLQDAGADLLVVECIPAELAARLSDELEIPVIGIGAGPDCDGQVLVIYDVLNISLGYQPKFAKNFMTGRDNVREAVAAYVQAVKSGEFPGPEHCVA